MRTQVYVCGRQRKSVLQGPYGPLGGKNVNPWDVKLFTKRVNIKGRITNKHMIFNGVLRREKEDFIAGVGLEPDDKGRVRLYQLEMTCPTQGM